CILTGEEHADMQRVGECVRMRRQRDLSRQAAFAAGDFREPDGSIELTVRCEKCGDVNRYEIESLVVGRSASGSNYFVGDDLACASCGQWADFELTNEAQMQMMGAMLRRVVAADLGQDVVEGPVKLIDMKYRWQTRPAPEVMAELRSAVAHNPREIVNSSITS